MTVQTATESNVQQAVPFFMVRDMNASLRFYTEGLGFRKTEEWSPDGKVEWCSLVIGDAALMLQEYRKAYLPTDKLGVGVSICFVCKDAVALYRDFRTRGIEGKRPFVGNRMWVTSLTDPDGYRVDFESPTDAPEESELPEGS